MRLVEEGVKKVICQRRAKQKSDAITPRSVDEIKSILPHLQPYVEKTDGKRWAKVSVPHLHTCTAAQRQ